MPKYHYEQFWPLYTGLLYNNHLSITTTEISSPKWSLYTGLTVYLENLKELEDLYLQKHNNKNQMFNIYHDKLLLIVNKHFSVKSYLPLIRKDSSTHMNGLAVYVKERLPFALELSLGNSADSYLCFWLALLHSVSYFFFLYWSPSSCFCAVLILFHLT